MADHVIVIAMTAIDARPTTAATVEISWRESTTQETLATTFSTPAQFSFRGANPDRLIFDMSPSSCEPLFDTGEAKLIHAIRLLYIGVTDYFLVGWPYTLV